MSRRRPATRRGFTMIEVLVAVSIMSVMAVMAWRGVDGIVRTKEASEARLDRVLALNTALGQWASDLAAIQETPWVPAVGYDGNTLRITRHAPQGVQLVAWTNRGGVWRRWSSPPTTRRGELQEWWLRSQSLEATAGDARVQEVGVVPGLTSWQVYFFRNNAWANPQSSDADQPPAPPPVAVAGGTGGDPAPEPARRQPTVPDGVRVVLAFAAGTDASAPGLTGQVVRDIVLRRQAAR